MKKTVISTLLVASQLYGSQNTYTDNAIKYAPTAIYVSKELMGDFILPMYFLALSHHESCITERHKRCWSPEAELYIKYPNNQPREQGTGIPQITRAWHTNGRVRMDTLSSLKKKYPRHLSELTWDNIKKRPDLQFKAMVLLFRDNYNLLPKCATVFDKTAMADSAYNGGFRDLKRDRELCGLRVGCDPEVWFGNVELMKSKSTKKWKNYGDRSPWDINRHHVGDVMNRLIPYYVNLWYNIEHSEK